MGVLTGRDGCINFDHTIEGCRIDKTFSELMSHESSIKTLSEIVRVLLILSHGQATVEHGFFTNKQLTWKIYRRDHS